MGRLYLFRRSIVAEFISSMDKEIVQLFRDILLICDDQGFIGRGMFAIDGSKLPSNASKEWSKKTEKGKNTFTERMKRKIDSVAGRALYAKCLAIGEPPFANIRSALRLDRFTMRGKRKVNFQWNLFCIVHNMKKVQRYGPGFA